MPQQAKSFNPNDTYIIINQGSNRVPYEATVTDIVSSVPTSTLSTSGQNYVYCPTVNTGDLLADSLANKAALEQACLEAIELVKAYGDDGVLIQAVVKAQAGNYGDMVIPQGVYLGDANYYIPMIIEFETGTVVKSIDVSAYDDTGARISITTPISTVLNLSPTSNSTGCIIETFTHTSNTLFSIINCYVDQTTTDVNVFDNCVISGGGCGNQCWAQNGIFSGKVTNYYTGNLCFGCAYTANAYVDGATFTNVKFGFGCVAYDDDASFGVGVNNCVFKNCSFEGNGLCYSTSTAEHYFTNNVIEDCTFEAGDYIHLNGTENTISDCKFFGLTFEEGIVTLIKGLLTQIVQDCIFSDIKDVDNQGTLIYGVTVGNCKLFNINCNSILSGCESNGGNIVLNSNEFSATSYFSSGFSCDNSDIIRFCTGAVTFVNPNAATIQAVIDSTGFQATV